jgi:hypothetical protein
MKLLKSLAVAVTTLAISAPAFAGRDQSQIMQNDQAVKRLQAERSLAGPVGEKGRIGPSTQADRRTWNVGNPSERVRR